MTTPVRIGIVGMGGFAGSHHNAVARLEAEGEFAEQLGVQLRLLQEGGESWIFEYARAALRLFLMIGDQALTDMAILFGQADAHGRHHDAVFQFHPVDFSG